MKKRIVTIVTTILLLSISTAFASERIVPDQYPTIQAAINDCTEGDVVIVQPGTYRGLGNKEINLLGKAITVRGVNPSAAEIIAQTIIDCEGAGRGFFFYMGEDSGSIIEGLSIINGNSVYGAAIYCCFGSSPTIRSCRMRDNSAIFGGAIAFIGGSDIEIINCTISGNSAISSGGAIYFSSSGAQLGNCIISGNTARKGGAIHCFDSDVGIYNCTVSRNTATQGGGIYCYSSSNLSIANSILWADTAGSGPEIYMDNSGDPSFVTISHCDIQGGIQQVTSNENVTQGLGNGNIDLDPVFVSGPLGDYYLALNSPCVDAGNNLAENLGLNGFTTHTDGQPDSGIVDMGYHYPTAAKTAAAIVDIKPEVLNVKSQGRWISCHIRLPAGYNVADIDLSSITLENGIQAVWVSVDEEEQTAVAKFDRLPSQETINTGQTEWTVSGQLADGTHFEGKDTVRVIDNGSKK
jgi:predicted outer membrane repeat protein